MTDPFTKPTVAAIIALCLCAAAVHSATLPQIPAAATALVVAPTNKPVTVYFGAWPTNQFFTNEVKEARSQVSTDYGNNIVVDSNYVVTVTIRTRAPAATNCVVTAVAGTNLSAALAYKPRTNSTTSIVTNTGPVTFWLPPTNRYVITLWGMMKDGSMELSAQSVYPSAPSNHVRFVWNLLFSDRIEKPTHQWMQGGQTYSFTLTNGVNMGTNRFVRAIGTAIIDDFTPKAVILDQGTFGIFTNSP